MNIFKDPGRVAVPVVAALLSAVVGPAVASRSRRGPLASIRTPSMRGCYAVSSAWWGFSALLLIGLAHNEIAVALYILASAFFATLATWVGREA